MKRLHVFLVLLILIDSINCTGTVRLKSSQNAEITETLNSVKQTQKDLAAFEKAMAEKAAQKGLNAQGQEDLTKTREKMKEMSKALQKRAEAPTPPALTDNESKNLVKAGTHLKSLSKAMLSSAGQTRPAPPPMQSNAQHSVIDSVKKAVSQQKKIVANPVTAQPQMTTEHNQRQEHNERKAYEGMKAEMGESDYGRSGDDGKTVQAEEKGTIADPVVEKVEKAPAAKKATKVLVKPAAVPKKRISSYTGPKFQPNTQKAAQTLFSPPEILQAMQPARQPQARAARRRTIPKAVPRAAHAPDAGLRKGIYTNNVPQIINEMDLHNDRLQQDNMINSAVVAKTLNDAADTVKALTAPDNSIEIKPIYIQGNSKRIAKKFAKATQSFNEKMATIDQQPANDDVSDDSALIKNTEIAVKAAKRTLKQLVNQATVAPVKEQTAPVVAPVAPAVAAPIATPKVEEKAAEAPVETQAVPLADEDSQIETWFDRAKKLSKLFVPTLTARSDDYDHDIYTTGETIPSEDKADLARTGDDFESLPNGSVSLPAGNVNSAMIKSKATAFVAQRKALNQKIRESRSQTDFLRPTPKIAVDTLAQQALIKTIQTKKAPAPPEAAPSDKDTNPTTDPAAENKPPEGSGAESGGTVG